MKYACINLFNSTSTMSRIKNGCTTTKDADDKLENQLDRILDSNACRKLFTWARPKDADTGASEIEKEVKEEQRLRWNFDFETETPLPGRYQWVRVDNSNGHEKDSDAVRSRVRNIDAVRRAGRQKCNTRELYCFYFCFKLIFTQRYVHQHLCWKT